MNSNLIIKEVRFNDADLMAAQDKATGKVYVGVSYICNGIGLTRDQAKNERKRIQDDLVLKQGGRNLTLPTNGGKQELLTIEIDFLPLWLAKISITPKMKKESPEVVNLLIEYQLKAKDILAKAFIQPQSTSTDLQAYVFNLAQGTQLIGQVVQGMQTAMLNMQTYIQDSIQAKDLQIDQTAEMIGLRDRNTKVLSSVLKDKLSNLTGRDITASSQVYKNVKENIFKMERVAKWEDISISKFNSVYAYIDSLEKDDI